MVKTIEDLPLNDRPYEKLEQIGSTYLTNSELLAIVIRTGTKEHSCLEISRNILKNNNSSGISDIEYLNSLSLQELKKHKGIGRVKAIQIQAVLELSKRLSSVYKSKKNKICSPKDVHDLLESSYLNEKQECLKTILLNKRNAVISIITNSIGTSDHISITLKEILSEPIKQMAHSIILVHNHPSGTLSPSRNDIRFTKNVLENSRVFNIQLLDHIIIANNKYISLKEEGYI